MIASDAYNYVNVLEAASNASWARNNVISNNIANVDTPGYKRKDVQFESYLEMELIRGGTLARRVSEVNLDQIRPVIYTDQASLSYRMDGNNVDIHTENTYLAENQIRYKYLINSMTQEFSRLRTAMTNPSA
ncbi:MAG: flagellar basal body rod protein FlgB [Catonella sp.]|nr:flagellar basal body rod protein FlgB [Catonella sp.]MDY6356188.1 flagellar basal body rod protein FlgB [Catonella sp.]